MDSSVWCGMAHCINREATGSGFNLQINIALAWFGIMTRAPVAWQNDISLKIVFVLANSADLDKMLQYAAFHLGLHCSAKYTFRRH